MRLTIAVRPLAVIAGLVLFYVTPCPAQDEITSKVDDKLTVIVFVNLAQANPPEIAHGVAAIYNRFYFSR